MNKDELEGQWKQMKGRAKEKWGKLTDDDLDEIQGRQQVLVGKIQERYGHDREAAKKAVDSWMSEHKDRRGSH
ncbi:MAG: CsbD family protein [Gemmatimonadota bacterium]